MLRFGAAVLAVAAQGSLVNPDHVDEHGPEPTREWHAAMAKIAPHHPIVTTSVDPNTAGSQYHYLNDFSPPMKTGYNADTSKTCCTSKCGSNTDCQVGCKLWMSSSSLNYEDFSWWPQLKMKCQRMCKQGRQWQDLEDASAGDRTDFGKKSYWSEFHFIDM